MRRLQLVLDVEDLVLAVPEKHETRRIKLRQLPGQFAPDGAAGSGNQDGLARDDASDQREIGPHGLTAQQVLNLDLAQVR